MTVQNITNISIDAAQIASNSTAMPEWLIPVGIGVLVFLLFALVGIMFGLGIFIASCFKQTLAFQDIFKNAIDKYKLYFKDLYAYFIPVVVIMVIGVIISVYDFFLELNTGKDIVDTYSLGTGIFILLLPTAILIVYYFIFENSFAMSCYRSLNRGSLNFEWISFGQFIKLFIGNFIFLFLYVLGMPFFMIPSILLAFAWVFVKYPIVVEDAGIFEAIGKSFRLLKENFWNVIFYVTMFSLIVSAIGSVLGGIPILGSVLYYVVYIVVQPIGVIFLTDVYSQLENK